jgi:hypothetical protein
MRAVGWRRGHLRAKHRKKVLVASGRREPRDVKIAGRVLVRPRRARYAAVHVTTHAGVDTFAPPALVLPLAGQPWPRATCLPPQRTKEVMRRAREMNTAGVRARLLVDRGQCDDDVACPLEGRRTLMTRQPVQKQGRVGTWREREVAQQAMERASDEGLTHRGGEVHHLGCTAIHRVPSCVPSQGGSWAAGTLASLQTPWAHHSVCAQEAHRRQHLRESARRWQLGALKRPHWEQKQQPGAWLPALSPPHPL